MHAGQLLNEWMSSYLSAKIDTLVHVSAHASVSVQCMLFNCQTVLQAWNHEKENGQKGEAFYFSVSA